MKLQRALHSFDVRWNDADSSAARLGAAIQRRRREAEQAHGNGGHDHEPDPDCGACEDARKARIAKLVRARERIATAILRNPSVLKSLRP